MNNLLLSESVLREAVIGACERENAACDRLVAERDEHVFSDEFEENIRKLSEGIGDIKKADIIEYPMLRVSKKSLRIKIALIAVIIMMFGSMTVIAVEPIREKMYKIVETLFMDHTDVSFEEVGGETGGEAEEGGVQVRSFNTAEFPKRLKWVSEGFEIYEDVESTQLFILRQFFTYKNSQGEWKQIDYQQIIMETMEYSSGWTITSDGTPAKEIEICGEKAKLYTDEGGYLSIILQKEGFALKFIPEFI